MKKKLSITLLALVVCLIIAPITNCYAATKQTTKPAQTQAQYVNQTVYGIYIENVATKHYLILCTYGSSFTFNDVPEIGIVNHDYIKITLKVNKVNKDDYQIQNITNATDKEFYNSVDENNYIFQ